METTGSPASRRLVAGAGLALVSYLLLVLAWFDQRLVPPARAIPVAVPLAGLLLGAALLAPAWRARDGAAGEGRWIALVFALALASRLPFLWGAYGLFSSDAAVQGIMALHILDGRHHPIFLYGWSYIGSLKAHATALLAWLSGEPVLAFEATAILAFAVFAAAVYGLARAVAGRGEALVAAGYVVLAPGFLTAWAAHNEGSYVDVLALGTMLLAVAARYVDEPAGRGRRAFVMGVLGGLAFWTHILATYYLLVALLVLLAAERGASSLRRVAAFAGGFAIGDAPGLVWNASNEWLSFRWWALGAASGGGEGLERAAEQLAGVFHTSFAVLAGYWPADAPPWPGGVLRPALALLFPLAAAVFVVRSRRALAELARGRIRAPALLVGFFALVILVFASSSFGWMVDEPRYLLFVFSVVPVFVASALAALWRRSRLAAVGLAAALAAVHLQASAGYWLRAVESDAKNRTFVAAVVELGARYAHTDYHLSYKYIFLSHERLVWSAALGPSQKEWYPPYRERVFEADRPALVPRSFRFARRICRRLDAMGVAYRRADLLYPVIYDLSETVPLDRLR